MRTRAANKSAAGNAGIASRLAIQHHWPGVPDGTLDDFTP